MSRRGAKDSLKLSSAGAAIRRLRESKNLSQKEMARLLNWPEGRLSKYETNSLALSVPVIEEIAIALGERPAAVALFCLREHFPDLGTTEVGRLLESLVAQNG